MVHTQETLKNDNLKIIDIDSANITFFNSDNLSLIDNTIDNEKSSDSPLIFSYSVSKTNSDYINTADKSKLFCDINTADEYNVVISDINVLNNNAVISELTKLYADHSILTTSVNKVNYYIKFEITETSNISFLDPNAQWIIDDNNRYNDEKYIFDAIDIILNYEYVNISPPTQADIDLLQSRFDMDNYPNIVLIKKINTHIISSIDEEDTTTTLNIPGNVPTYDLLLYNQYRSNTLIKRSVFIDMISDLDNDTPNGTAFSDVIDDIKNILYDVTLSHETYIQFYGYDYKIYDSDNDMLYTTDSQYFKINTDIYVNDMFTTYSNNEDIFNTVHEIDIDNNAIITDTEHGYVQFELFDDDSPPQSLLSFSNVEVLRNKLKFKISNLSLNQASVPKYILIYN